MCLDLPRTHALVPCGAAGMHQRLQAALAHLILLSAPFFALTLTFLFLLRAGHLILCAGCVLKLQEQSGNNAASAAAGAEEAAAAGGASAAARLPPLCPMCREPFTRAIRVLQPR